jgi:hypothetical protein
VTCLLPGARERMAPSPPGRRAASPLIPPAGDPPEVAFPGRPP